MIPGTSMFDPALPPLRPRAPQRATTTEEHTALLRRLQEPLDAMVPTPFMIVCLVIGLAAFLWTVCFVAYKDYDRQHPGTETETEVLR